VSLEEAGVVPDIIPEKFATKTTLRVKYPAWVKSAVNLKDVSSFGGTPTRGAGEIGMGQVRIVERKSVFTRLCGCCGLNQWLCTNIVALWMRKGYHTDTGAGEACGWMGGREGCLLHACHD